MQLKAESAEIQRGGGAELLSHRWTERDTPDFLLPWGKAEGRTGRLSSNTMWEGPGVRAITGDQGRCTWPLAKTKLNQERETLGWHMCSQVLISFRKARHLALIPTTHAHVSSSDEPSSGNLHSIQAVKAQQASWNSTSPLAMTQIFAHPKEKTFGGERPLGGDWVLNVHPSWMGLVHTAKGPLQKPA